MHLLAISGSLRSGSYNTALLREAAALAPAGVTVDLYDGLDRLPPFNDDLDGDAVPAEVARLRAAIAAADALIVATPEYNATIPGQLKNAVDWASRPRDGAALGGTSVAIMGASTGQYGAMWAQHDLRRTLGTAGARPLKDVLPVARVRDRFDEHGRLADEGLRGQLAGVVAALVDDVRDGRAAATGGRAPSGTAA